MDSTIQQVRPAELPDIVESDAVTLVLGAPGLGTAQHLQSLGQAVDGLPETAAVDDDELVVVDGFVSAVFDLEDEHVSAYTDDFGEKSVFTRSGGTVLVSRPRSFDWLCQSEHGVSGSFIETVDAVVVVRTPPTDGMAAIEAVRDRISFRGSRALRADDRAALLEQARYPPYYFTTPELQRHLGWYDATVTPAAFLSLSKHDETGALLPGDVRRTFEDSDVTVGPFTAEFEDLVSDLVPSGGLPSRVPSDRSPAVLAAVALAAVGLAEDADWLDSFAGYRIVPAAAEALEDALDLPPGTVDHLRVFAADPTRGLLRERLVDKHDDGSAPDVDDGAVSMIEAGSIPSSVREPVAAAVDALNAECSSLEAISTPPEEYGSSLLVGSWNWDGPQALHDAAAERELPNSSSIVDGTDETNPDETDETNPDWSSFVDRDELLAALDGGLVVLSGPKSSGKRQLAASLVSELEGWGTRVILPKLGHPDHVRTGIEATPNAVVVASYGTEPAQIVGDDGVRALPEWVAAGSCVGAILVCDDSNRENLDEAMKRVGCDDVTAWTDRVEFSIDGLSGDTDRDPAAVARDLLDAIGWPEVDSPSRQSVDVERVTDQSTLAAIAGVPDHALDDEFVGTVVAEAVDVISTTHGPAAAEQWLSVIDDLVAGVGRKRTPDSDESLLYRGEVYATAIAAVATANPRTDEWVHAVARGVLEVTNETAAPFVGRESVGGDLEPFATAFTGALARLAQPPDGSTVNHGAIGCVDEALHTMVVDDGWQFPLHFVYGGAVGRIVRRADDPRAANGGIATVVSRVRQYAMSPNDRYTVGVLGNSFASMLGAVAGVECSPAELSAWVADIATRAREATQDVIDQGSQRRMLKEVFVAGLGLWVFEHDCPDEEFGPFLDAVGKSACQTATAAELDEDPGTFVRDVYGQVVRVVVQSGDLDRADLFFAECHRLVDAIAESDGFDTKRDGATALHAAGLAAFGDVELDDPDAVSSYPYGKDTIAFEDSLGFEDWMERYETSVTRGVGADASAERTQYLTAVYCGALSTRVRGFDPGSDQSNDSDDGVTPRGEQTWYAGLTNVIDTRATTDSVDDPVQFLEDVYGGAATNWATDGASDRTQEWVTRLGQSLRTSRETTDGPDALEWFDAFASTDAEILAGVLTRTDVGERTHERLVEAVLSRIEATATDPDYPPHPIQYVVSVFGGAVALAADAPPEEVRFAVTETLAVLDGEFSLDWIDGERAEILERIYAEALATVGRTHTGSSGTDEWLEIVTARIEATASEERPAQPATFVAAVYARARFETAQGGTEEWGRRLDTEIREYARGPDVTDPAAFLVRLYADIVVTGAKRHSPSIRIEACIDAVSESLRAARDADLFPDDDALKRTVSRAADTLSSTNIKDTGQYALRIDHGLRKTGYEAVANELFDGEAVSNTDGGLGNNPPEQEDR